MAFTSENDVVYILECLISFDLSLIKKCITIDIVNREVRSITLCKGAPRSV